MKKSFTLIELLVVVAIIGILASMLMPSLGRARSKAKSAVCINNLKSITTGIMMYLDSNSDAFPIQKNGYQAEAYYNSGTLTTTTWGNYQPYIDMILDSKESFICPMTLTPGVEAFRDDYSFNAHLHNGDSGSIIKIGQVTNPTETMTNTDTNYEWLQYNIPGRIQVRHFGRLNHAWVDGHVNSLPWENFYNNRQWIQFENAQVSFTGDFDIKN